MTKIEMMRLIIKLTDTIKRLNDKALVKDVEIRNLMSVIREDRGYEGLYILDEIWLNVHGMTFEEKKNN